MREILFRGKRIDNDRWVEGYFVKKFDPLLLTEMCFILVQEYDTSCIDGTPTVLKSEMTWYRVHPESVGQYTGLTDKNGKKNFEGDIVEIKIADLKKHGVVFFGERAARYGVVESDGTINYSFLQQSLVRMYGVRVVGNIHDNPDLLGGVRNAKKIKRLAYSQAGRL